MMTPSSRSSPPAPLSEGDDGAEVGRGRVSRLASGAASQPRGPLVAFAVLCVAAVILSAFAYGPSTLPGDVRIATWVQGWHGSLPQLLADFGNGFAAGPTAIAIWLALLLGSVAMRRNLDTAFLFALGVLRWLGSLTLKELLVSPRPEASQIAVHGQFGGYGFPSGHTLTATCLGGAILLIANRRIPRGVARRIVSIIAVLLPLITGFARVYVGAHWPSDVLGGWLWGSIALMIAWAISERMVRRVTPKTPPAGV